MTKIIHTLGDLVDIYKLESPEHSDKFMMVSVILGIIDDEMHENYPSLDRLKHKIETFANDA